MITVEIFKDIEIIANIVVTEKEAPFTTISFNSVEDFENAVSAFAVTSRTENSDGTIYVLINNNMVWKAKVPKKNTPQTVYKVTMCWSGEEIGTYTSPEKAKEKAIDYILYEEYDVVADDYIDYCKDCDVDETPMNKRQFVTKYWENYTEYETITIDE